MKLRIKGNSIRLRLTQIEVATLKENGSLSDQIQFGLTADELLTYKISTADCDVISAHFKHGEIVVQVPSQTVQLWAKSDQVGLEARQSIHSSNSDLLILIEKDFRCLTPRTHEDETHLFPHPNENTAHC